MSSTPWMPGLHADVRVNPAHATVMAAVRGGRGGRRRHGRAGFRFPPGFGPPGGDFRRWDVRFGARPRVGRGDVRAAVLALLAEGPRTGYEIIQEVAERSGGLWRPSAGSVYPVLQQLEDEGLAASVQSDKRKVMELTEAGHRYVQEHAEHTAAPWEAVRDSVDEDDMEIWDLLRQLFMAAVQVQQAGSATQAEEMRRVLADTRRALYRILAEDDAGEDDLDV